jgi:hypothetical protein
METTNAIDMMEAGDLRARWESGADLKAMFGELMEGPAFGEELHGFLREHLTWEKLQPEFVALYCSVYTEAEMADLAAFYRTPVGQKMLEVGSALALGSVRIMRDALESHSEALGAIVERALLARAGADEFVH